MSTIRILPHARPGIGLAVEVTTLLMVITGYGALFFTGEMGSVHIIIISAGILFSLFWDESAHPISSLVWNGLIIGFLGFGLVEWFYLAGGFVKAVVHFLGYVQLVLLISRNSDRDTLWLHLLSLLQLTAAAILTLSMSFLIFFFVYILVSTWALIIFTIKREAQRARAEVGPESIRGGFYAASAGVAFCIFVVAMAVFFIIPRLGAGFFGWAHRGGVHVTGFSETIDIGDVGRIKQDTATVMRVSIIGETTPRETLYWRGNALDSFDGRSWTAAFAGSSRLFPDIEGVFRVNDKDRGKMIEEEIYLEPINSTVLFAASQPTSFTLRQHRSMRQDMLSRIGALIQHGNDYWSLPIGGPIQDRIRYWATSDISEPDASSLRAATTIIPDDIRLKYLELPALDKRVSELAMRMTKGLADNYDKTIAVRDYLLNNYGYTLDQAEKAPEDPLVYFLFDRKAGHCEYFSTAMAVLLRVNGIPTRVVNGYQRGEWNDADYYYRVRQSDAHSWVEVYFGDEGWVMFDPTPSASITYDKNTGMLSKLDLMFDTWRYRWNRYIVDYTFDDQAQTTMRVRDRGGQVGAQFYRGFSDLMRSVRESIPRVVGAALIGLAIIACFAYIILRLVRARSEKQADRITVPDNEARRIYIKTLRLLDKRGLGRKPSLTPREHAGWVVSKKGEEYGAIMEMAAIFSQTRFGGREPLPHQIDSMRKIFKTIHDLR